MKYYKKIFFTTTILCIFFSSLSYSSPNKESISNLLNLSGVSEVFELVPDLVSEGFIDGFTEEMSITDEEEKALLNDIKQSFNSSIFQNSIQLIIEAGLNEGELATLLKWYESDLGMLITKVEIKSSTDSAYNEVMKNAVTLMKDTKRLEMAKRIDKLLDETSKMMKLQKKIGLSVYAGIVSSLEPSESHKLIAEYEAEIADMDDMLRAGLQQYIYASFIYTYQDINDSDMEKYELFLGLNASQKFGDAVINGIEDGFDEAISILTKKMASTLRTIIDRSVSEANQE